MKLFDSLHCEMSEYDPCQQKAMINRFFFTFVICVPLSELSGELTKRNATENAAAR